MAVMKTASLSVQGPIARSLVAMIRRRLGAGRAARLLNRSTATAAAGAAVLAATAIEPNLSGEWIRDDGVVVRIHHVGNRIRAYFPDSVATFEAMMVDEARMSGFIWLYWNEQPEHCPNEPYRSRTFSGRIDWEKKILHTSWSHPRRNSANCALLETDIQREADQYRLKQI